MINVEKGRIAGMIGGVTETIVETEAGTEGTKQMTEGIEMISGIVIGMIEAVGVAEVIARIDGIKVTVVIEVTVGSIGVTVGSIGVAVGAIGVTVIIGVSVGVIDGTMEIEVVIGVTEDLVAEVSWCTMLSKCLVTQGNRPYA